MTSVTMEQVEKAEAEADIALVRLLLIWDTSSVPLDAELRATHREHRERGCICDFCSAASDYLEARRNADELGLIFDGFYTLE